MNNQQNNINESRIRSNKQTAIPEIKYQLNRIYTQLQTERDLLPDRTKSYIRYRQLSENYDRVQTSLQTVIAYIDTLE